MTGFHKSASNKVNTILGKRKLSTPAFKPGKSSGAPVTDASAPDAGTYAKTPPTMRVSYGDTGDPADEQG